MSANVGGTTITCSNCACESANVDVDAKGIVEFTYTLKLTGAATGI